MSEVRAGVRVNRTVDDALAPGQVQWVGTGAQKGLSTLKDPNPDQTSIRLSYDSPAVPEGADAVKGFRIFKNGTAVLTVAATTLQPAFGAAYDLVAGASNVWEVQAFNDAGGDGPKSEALTFVQRSATADAPAAPTGAAVSGTPAVDGGTVTWTASTTPGVSYNVYVDGNTTRTANVSTTSYTLTGLSAGTAHPVTIKAVLNNVESTTGTTTTLTTAADTSAIQLATADAFTDTVYGQAKVTYGGTRTVDGVVKASNVHSFKIAANKQAVIDWYKASKWRSYRQEIPVNSDQRTAQLEFMRAVFANHGCKFQANIGAIGWSGRFRINSYDELETYAAVNDEVQASLKWLVDVWLPDTTLNIDDLSEVIHSIGGPNEVNDGNGHVNANWARSARIYAEVIWQLMRNGKVWNGVYTRAEKQDLKQDGTLGPVYWDYTVTPPQTGTTYGFVTPTGGKADFANYSTYFAKVPIMACSSRLEFTDAQARELGGDLIPASEAPAGTRLHGRRRIAKFHEVGNCHQYQNGKPPDGSRLVSEGTARWDNAGLLPAKGFTASRPWEGAFEFTEGGYNHMGYHPDGRRTTEGGEGSTSPDGNVKVPPWVMGVYVPILHALCFKNGWKFHLFEMLNDEDTPTSTTRNYDIQAYFGHIWTPDYDPTTWIPLASFNATRRMQNLLYDRGSTPKVPASNTATRRPMTVTTRNGVEIIELTKTNGETYYLVWRDNLSIFSDDRLWTDPRIVYTNASGVETRGLPPAVNLVCRLDHTSGTRQVDLFIPNKARWTHAGVSNPTFDQSRVTTSTGHDDTTDWSGTNPTPDTALGSIAAGGSFTVPVGHDLVIVRVK